MKRTGKIHFPRAPILPLIFNFVNLSAQIMYLTPIGIPSALKGYYLGPNGGTLSISAEEDGEVVAWEWLGVALGAASPYFLLETRIAVDPAGA